MAKQLNFEGMEKKEVVQKFVKFEKKDDFIKGVFLGIKNSTPSAQYPNASTVNWLVEVEDSNIKGVVLGDKVKVSEKTVMQPMRDELEEGQIFALVYDGEVKPTEKGKKAYKSFSLYL